MPVEPNHHNGVPATVPSSVTNSRSPTLGSKRPEEPDTRYPHKQHSKNECKVQRRGGDMTPCGGNLKVIPFKCGSTAMLK